MTKLRWILLVLLIAASIGYAIGVQSAVTYHKENKDVVASRLYTGRIYLTDNEYEEFKKYLADHPDILIEKLDILASKNPLIDFRFSVPGEEAFPWGNPIRTLYVTDSASLSILIVFYTFGLGIFFAFFIGGICWEWKL